MFLIMEKHKRLFCIRNKKAEKKWWWAFFFYREDSWCRAQGPTPAPSRAQLSAGSVWWCRAAARMQVFQLWPVLFLQPLCLFGQVQAGSHGIIPSYRSPPSSVLGIWRGKDTVISVHCSGFLLTLAGSNLCLPPDFISIFLLDFLILGFLVIS